MIVLRIIMVILKSMNFLNMKIIFNIGEEKSNYNNYTSKENNV